jgi:hypothetical protein
MGVDLAQAFCITNPFHGLCCCVVKGDAGLTLGQLLSHLKFI